ncbi:hypothetical protein [Salinirubrum litoreum]|uniref:Uncharacterized protein n=1 Tax=Salinirubrum litoreum TaxID=1126234 RepID=A0ABD5R8R2_9EURY|nr:hypothetical protein [Salinirubrum litoreum]
MFPAETLPDGALFGPHHFLYPLYAMLFLAARKWDLHPRKEPVLVVASALLALFAWAHVWKYYPVFGATMALAGVCGTILGGLLTWRYGRRFQIAVVGLGLAALDDAVSHAFGVWTPLDHLWGVWWAIYHGERVPVVAESVRDPATALADLQSAVGESLPALPALPALGDLPTLLVAGAVRALARLPILAPHTALVPL